MSSPEGGQTRARLRQDQDADETLLPMFVFMATFVSVMAFLILTMTPLFNSVDARGDWQGLENYAVIGGVDYYLFDPVEGYNITSADVLFNADKPAGDGFTFTNDSYADRYVNVYRDYSYPDDSAGPIDFVLVTSEWGSWYNRHIGRELRGFSEIGQNQVPETNQSVTPYGIRGTSEVLIITTPGNDTDFSDYLWSNTFNIALGVPVNPEETVASTSLWVIIGQLLTASLPDVNPTVNFLIAIPFWAAIGFGAFTIVSRMIPFVGGG